MTTFSKRGLLILSLDGIIVQSKPWRRRSFARRQGMGEIAQICILFLLLQSSVDSWGNEFTEIGEGSSGPGSQIMSTGISAMTRADIFAQGQINDTTRGQGPINSPTTGQGQINDTTSGPGQGTNPIHGPSQGTNPTSGPGHVIEPAPVLPNASATGLPTDSLSSSTASKTTSGALNTPSNPALDSRILQNGPPSISVVAQQPQPSPSVPNKLIARIIQLSHNDQSLVAFIQMGKDFGVALIVGSATIIAAMIVGKKK